MLTTPSTADIRDSSGKVGTLNANPDSVHSALQQASTRHQSHRSSAASAASLSTVVIASILAHFGVHRITLDRVSTTRPRCPAPPLPHDNIVVLAQSLDSNILIPLRLSQWIHADPPRSRFQLVQGLHRDTRQARSAWPYPVVCTTTTTTTTTTISRPSIKLNLSTIHCQFLGPTSIHRSCIGCHTVQSHRHVCITNTTVDALVHLHNQAPVQPTIPNKTCRVAVAQRQGGR